jgi:cyclase
MLRARVIPTLLVHDKGLVKTVKFGEGKYVGDPLNAVRIFNEKEVDEIVVLDIDATVRAHEPDYTLIRKLAAECRMPLCYGGGVHTVDQVVRLINMGVEKVSISAAAISRPAIIDEMARYVGNQSIVITLDVKRGRQGYEVWTHNATRNTGREPVALAREFEGRGAGEITLNAIDNDGVMKGYDLELARQVRAAVNVPMTILGGAGSLRDIEGLVKEFDIIGAAAGSLFVFKGVYKAVLINYPNRAQKYEICGRALPGVPG